MIVINISVEPGIGHFLMYLHNKKFLLLLLFIFCSYWNLIFISHINFLRLLPDDLHKDFIFTSNLESTSTFSKNTVIHAICQTTSIRILLVSLKFMNFRLTNMWYELRIHVDIQWSLEFSVCFYHQKSFPPSVLHSKEIPLFF